LKFLNGVLFLALLVGCQKSTETSQSPIDAYKVEDLPQDFQVPDFIWDIANKVIPPNKPKTIIYGPVHLKLAEKNKGILKESTLLFVMQSGGGELDLSKVVSGQPGSFSLGFDVPIKDKILQTKVFFISQNRQRKVGGEVLGSGCKKVLELTTQFGKLGFLQMLDLNTTRYRHLSVLGGHFLFLVETEKNWIVSQVSFYDSERSDLFCPGFRSTEVNK
jgi:hypothetical protein